MRTYPSFQADGKTLSPKIQRAIEHYLDLRDVGKAGVLAGFDDGEFIDIFKRLEVRQEVERRLEIEDQAHAEIRARSRMLHVGFLDSSLVTAVKAGSEKGDIKALELGYERLGLRRDDNFMTEAQSSPQERPREMYRVLRQTVTTEVQQLEGGATAALPAPLTIEGRRPDPHQISADIEDY